MVIFLCKQIPKIHWCKYESTFAMLMLRLEESSLQALMRDGVMYEGKSWSCFEEKLNSETKICSCLQICPFLSCPPPLILAVPDPSSPLGSLLACASVTPTYSAAPLGSDASAAGRGPWDLIPQSLFSLLEEGGLSPVFTKHTGAESSPETSICLSVLVEMGWQVKTRLDAMAAQSHTTCSLKKPG